jgi:hypothetical protein
MADGWSLGGSALCVERAERARPDADPQIEKIVASISEDRLKELLTKLVSFGTRNTLSDQESPTRGIGAARNWILEEMRRSSEKLRVNFDTAHHPPQGRITEAGRSAQRHRDPAGTLAAAHLHFRSLRLGEHRRTESVELGGAGANTGGDRRPVRSSMRMSRRTAPTTMAAARC